MSSILKNTRKTKQNNNHQAIWWQQKTGNSPISSVGFQLSKPCKEVGSCKRKGEIFLYVAIQWSLTLLLCEKEENVCITYIYLRKRRVRLKIHIYFLMWKTETNIENRKNKVSVKGEGRGSRRDRNKNYYIPWMHHLLQIWFRHCVNILHT